MFHKIDFSTKRISKTSLKKVKATLRKKVSVEFLLAQEKYDLLINEYFLITISYKIKMLILESINLNEIRHLTFSKKINNI